MTVETHEGAAPAAQPEPSGLSEAAWKTLVSSVARGQCTPFVGAGIAGGALPLGGTLADEFATQYGYPFTDTWNLPRVSQYLAIVHDSDFVKTEVIERLARLEYAYLAANDGRPPLNYQLLAALKLKTYITTNYDGFLERALTDDGRPPLVEVCRWNDALWRQLQDYPENVRPSVERPVLFHLHGRLSNGDSILLTEDDYVDFIVTMARRSAENAASGVLWHHIDDAFAGKLLFVGYSLEDWNFRILLRYIAKQRALIRSDQKKSVAVQVAPNLDNPDSQARAREFLSKYLDQSSVQLFWTDAQQFLTELTSKVAEERARLTVPYQRGAPGAD